MCKEGHEKLGDKISKAHARSSGNSAPRKKVGSPSASGSLSPDMESLRNEQYAALKFCVRLQKSSTEAYALLKQAYGEDVLPQSTAFRWLKQFKEGRGSITKNTSPGCPSTAVNEITINTAAVIVREDRRITLDRLANMLNISHGSAFKIIHNHLHMRRVCARWVPRLLTPEQMMVRVEVCQELQRLVAEHGEAYLNSIITGDETWLHHYDPESKQASSVWKTPSSPTPKKAKVVRSARKVMMISFFDYRGMVYQHEVPPRTTVNGEYYKQVLKHLAEHIRRKRPELYPSGWRLHHDNARPHVCNIVTQYLARKNIECVPHPPYSPDLAPCDFFLFPRLKSDLRGQRFESSMAVVKKAEAVLKSMSQNGFQHVFQEWQTRWAKCIQLNGDYFEKDHTNLDPE